LRVQQAAADAAAAKETRQKEKASAKPAADTKDTPSEYVDLELGIQTNFEMKSYPQLAARLGLDETCTSVMIEACDLSPTVSSVRLCHI
jgi:hypothetical protein